MQMETQSRELQDQQSLQNAEKGKQSISISRTLLKVANIAKNDQLNVDVGGREKR